MKKKLLAFVLLLGLVQNEANAATYYFSKSGSNGAVGTSTVAPFHDYKGTTLDNDNALSAGDWVRYKRGEACYEGSEAEVINSSNGTAGSHIHFGAYGTGTNPCFALAPVTSTSWVNTGNNIYSHTGFSSTWLDSVTQDDNKALFYFQGETDYPGWAGGAFYDNQFCNHTDMSTCCSGTHGEPSCLTVLPEGTFQRSGSTLYVHLWGNGDPATHSVRVASFSQTSDADGSRGMFSAGKRTSGNSKGQYTDVVDWRFVGSNGVGVSTSATYTQTAGLNIMGAGSDGFLAYCDLTGSGECGDHYRNYYDEISYSAAGANGGGGHGQGWTSYAPYGWSIGVYSHHNAMAGMDWLNFGPSTNVTEFGCIGCRSDYNGLAQAYPSYDAAYYTDGANKGLLHDVEEHGGGLGVAVPKGMATDSRSGFAFSSEHPATDPVHHIYLNDALGYGTNWEVLNTSTTDVHDIYVTWYTFTAVQAYTFVRNTSFTHDSSTNSFHLRNGIMVVNSSGGARVDMYMDIGAYLDIDYTQYFKRGSASAATNLYQSGSTNYNLAQFQATLANRDAHSAYGDPKLTTDTDALTDAHLLAGSPAIDTGVVNPLGALPAWIPATVAAEMGPYGVRGTTQASGVLDDVATLPDKGYHYSYRQLTSTNVEPASLIASAVGNVTVSWTIPDLVSALLYNWKIKVVFPAGYNFNSGGTTGVTLGASITGTATVGISGQVVTITRVGDGDSQFPGDFSLVLSNIQNPSAIGATGTYTIVITDANDNVIASEDAGVSADTITSGGGGGGVAPHFSCSKMNLSKMTLS